MISLDNYYRPRNEVPKTKNGEGLSFLRSLPVCYISEVSIASVIAFLLSKIGMPVNEIYMSLIYFILMAVAIGYMIIKRKSDKEKSKLKFQKYYFDWMDLINYGFLFVIVLFIIWRIFGFDLYFYYLNTQRCDVS